MDPARISRREFARFAAAAAAVSAALPRGLVAQEAAAPPDLPPASLAEAEARYQAILRKHGSRLSTEQKAQVLKSVMETQKGLDVLRAFPLENGDEPATVLHLELPGGK